MTRSLAALIGALVLGGCYPDLGAYRVGAPEGVDAQVPPNRDAGEVEGDACAPPVTCGGDCALPWLLASVEDLGEECGGQVWRFSLYGMDGEFCACEPLTGGGEIPRLPFSVGFAPPETVVVAAEDDRVMAIDGRTDTVLWQEPYTSQPVDVFAISDPTGTPMIAVAGRRRGISQLASIRFYDAARGGAPIERTFNGDLPLGLNVLSVSQSSFDRTWFRAVKNGFYAAADVDPWTDTRFDMPFHTLDREGFVLDTLHSSYDGRFHRTVWTGDNDGTDGVYRLALGTDTGDNRVPLADRCRDTPEGADYDVTCDYLHAVADPQLNTASIAICQYDGSVRRIVRMRTTGACYDMADEGLITPRIRISRLALAQSTFWP